MSTTNKVHTYNYATNAINVPIPILNRDRR